MVFGLLIGSLSHYNVNYGRGPFGTVGTLLEYRIKTIFTNGRIFRE